ncbi:Diamine acetyltransferase [Babesia sp. Xinjiang]|uniref:Diamine acetyltransferase n=1 Tax=Babesia sp. Xinjiang TaxID=462227 RepID=UPI000A21BAF7|nr:Diamine acetyltransferase [Babesia sp. Xinjiang]ORM39581.1 Diamine acetyltransferase [Babesia sp. Xinjiang]
MAETPTLESLFDKKVVICEEFELDGLNLVFKCLDSYEEYLEVLPLVKKLSRCSLEHHRAYVDSMLRMPLYYPFVVRVLDSVGCDDVTSSSSSVRSVNSDGSSIIGYIEVYAMPHLGRLFDCRFERVIVDPAYRNRGVCHKMLSIAIEFCTSVLRCNRIDLTSDNPLAIHIYEKFGFEHVNVNTYRKTVL